MPKPKKHRLKALGSGGVSKYKLQTQLASMQATQNKGGLFADIAVNAAAADHSKDEPEMIQQNASSAEFSIFNSYQGDENPQDRFRLLKEGKNVKELFTQSTAVIENGMIKNLSAQLSQPLNLGNSTSKYVQDLLDSFQDDESQQRRPNSHEDSMSKGSVEKTTLLEVANRLKSPFDSIESK